jgi:hypothetical protein
MAINITTLASSFTHVDGNGNDTITVGDDPATNGFQTAQQITDGIDTFILANHSALVIDGVAVPSPNLPAYSGVGVTRFLWTPGP